MTYYYVLYICVSMLHDPDFVQRHFKVTDPLESVGRFSRQRKKPEKAGEKNCGTLFFFSKGVKNAIITMNDYHEKKAEGRLRA